MTLYCLFGRIADKKYAKGDATGILQLAWRCLYAETVAARVDKRPIDLGKTYLRVLNMALTRLKAYGYSWRIWHIKNANTSRKSVIPTEKRKRGLLQQTQDGIYTILHLDKEIERIKQNTT